MSDESRSSKEERVIRLGFEALHCQASDAWDRALNLRQQEEQILRELGDEGGLEYCLSNQAIILKHLGHFDAALAVLEEQQRICRSLGHESSLATSVKLEAEILTARNKSETVRRDSTGPLPLIAYVAVLVFAVLLAWASSSVWLGVFGFIMVLYALGIVSGMASHRAQLGRGLLALLWPVSGTVILYVAYHQWHIMWLAVVLGAVLGLMLQVLVQTLVLPDATGDEQQSEEGGAEPDTERARAVERVVRRREPQYPGHRVIRIFVSSTFRDMQEERDELVKYIFPQVRKLCEQRWITWGEVDLRWGITEEQAAEGQVLPLCLEWIRRCRPYFIGLLGERYGWIPDEIPTELIEQEPWLAQHLEHSVTELEILHGVLNDLEMADHAYFYFRDPEYVDSLPAEVHADYCEVPIDAEVATYGLAEAERRAENRRRKLATLKGRIRESGLPVREPYANPVEMGERVLEDLTALIDRLYPEGEEPDPLDREAAEHEAFAASRAGVYIGRQAYSDRLDAHVGGEGEPLVVLGESGSGKSALLANWALRYREEHPEEVVLMHFVGASPYSADWRAMLRRIMSELKLQLGLEDEVPDEPDTLRASFANWLYMAAARSRVVLLLDALNQLEDREGAPDLLWLPPQVPQNVRLIVSTLPGRSLDAIRERGWPTLEVELLQPKEREQLIKTYLAQYSKALSPERVAYIAANPQAANPLYLRTLLEELRVFGVHEELDQRIDHYLEAGEIGALYGKVLQRYEEDYQRDRPGLVEGAMSLLWAARRGLSEPELLDLLGRDGQRLPQAYWSPLYLAAEGSLVDRAGLISYSHDYLRQAVQDRYLPTERERRSVHGRLADYFSAQDLGPRKIDELPWQLEQAESWQRLFALLADTAFLTVAWHSNEFDVKARWAALEDKTQLRKQDAYRSVLDAPREHLTDLGPLVMLLIQTGDLHNGLALCEQLAPYLRETGNWADLATCLGTMATTERDLGNLRRALTLHREEESIFRKLSDAVGLGRTYGNQAIVLGRMGDLNAAMKLHRKAEHIYQRLDDKDGLQRTWGNQAVILKSFGRLDEAMALQKKKERICRELSNKASLHIALGNQGTILVEKQQWDEAMSKHREKELICRELGDKGELGYALGNQAVILANRGQPQQAMEQWKEQEDIFREIGNPEGLAECLANQGALLWQRGSRHEGLELIEEAYQLATDHELGTLVSKIERLRSLVRGR